MDETNKNIRNMKISIQRKQNDYLLNKSIVSPTLKNNNISLTSRNSAIKDLESFTKQNLNKDDIGCKSIITTYDMVKTTVKLTEVNQLLFQKSIHFGKNIATISGVTYKLGNDLKNAYKTGTTSKLLDVYKNNIKENMVKTIKYSKPVYRVEQISDRLKLAKLYTKAAVLKTKNVVRGTNANDIKNVIRKSNFNTFSINKATFQNAKNGINLTSKSLVSAGKPINRSLTKLSNGIHNVTKNSDDIGVEAVDGTLTSIRYTGKTAKTTYNFTKSTVKGFSKVGKGTITLGKDISRMGVKKASKFYWKSYGKSFGKKLTTKLTDKLMFMLKKLMFNPMVIFGACIIIMGTTVISSGVIAGTAVVGGVVEFFKELGEGLQEVWDEVYNSIKDFLGGICDWVVSLFSDNEDIDIGVDVDVGEQISVSEYILGTVQLYKAKYKLEIEERHRELIHEEGYHDVLFFNTKGEDIVIGEINDTNKGLMSDQDYVDVISPIWQAVVLGTIGTDFTGKQANEVSKECFEAITIRKEEPLVVVNGKAGYIYCDGSTSAKESQNKVYTKFGNIEYHTDCLNSSEVKYHTSDEGFECDQTVYWCGGHEETKYCFEGYNKNKPADCTNYSIYYKCKGHYYPGGHLYFCSQDYKSEPDTCNNYDIYYKCDEHIQVTYCYEGESIESKSTCNNESSRFKCQGYQMCKGHKIMKFVIGSDGIYDLLDYYFAERIRKLESEDTLSVDEKEELDTLTMYYEYALGVYKINGGEDDAVDGDDGDYDIGNGSGTGYEVAKIACEYIGRPYVWGGNSLTNGTDCSGFVQKIYAKFGYSLPRKSTAQHKVGMSVPNWHDIKNLQAGDIVCWTKPYNHVAIYIGDGKIVHASNPSPYPKGGIKISNVFYSTPCDVRRIIK